MGVSNLGKIVYSRMVGRRNGRQPRCPHCNSIVLALSVRRKWSAEPGSTHRDATTIRAWECKECRRKFEVASGPYADLLRRAITCSVCRPRNAVSSFSGKTAWRTKMELRPLLTSMGFRIALRSVISTGAITSIGCAWIATISRGSAYAATLLTKRLLGRWIALRCISVTSTALGQDRAAVRTPQLVNCQPTERPGCTRTSVEVPVGPGRRPGSGLAARGSIAGGSWPSHSVA